MLVVDAGPLSGHDKIAFDAGRLDQSITGHRRLREPERAHDPVDSEYCVRFHHVPHGVKQFGASRTINGLQPDGRLVAGTGRACRAPPT
ncbi:hypothetical protein [Streptomyces sp. NPDC056105]|uniref:hypothetical protein n=1 Tax=Streptomyces sp. NPDC056105 TaxID=3345714 RepID=UPI0035E1AF24